VADSARFPLHRFLQHLLTVPPDFQLALLVGPHLSSFDISRPFDTPLMLHSHALLPNRATTKSTLTCFCSIQKCFCDRCHCFAICKKRQESSLTSHFLLTCVYVNLTVRNVTVHLLAYLLQCVNLCTLLEKR